MANILRGYGLAREQGFFKQEQVRQAAGGTLEGRVCSLESMRPPPRLTCAAAASCCPVYPPQEADLQRHRQRLIREGKLSPEEARQQEEAEAEAARAAGGAAAGAAARPRHGAQQGQTFEASEHSYETLAEVLQQQARLDDPDALRRRQYER